MAIKITLLGTQAQTATHGLIAFTRQELSDRESTESGPDLAKITLGYVTNLGNKGHITIELYDKNGTKVASGSQSLSSQLFPNIVLKGKTGEAAAPIADDEYFTSWQGLHRYVDVASFSTGKLRITVSGKQASTSSIRAQDAYGDNAVAHDMNGNGAYEMEVPFTVEAV